MMDGHMLFSCESWLIQRSYCRVELRGPLGLYPIPVRHAAPPASGAEVTNVGSVERELNTPSFMK